MGQACQHPPADFQIGNTTQQQKIKLYESAEPQQNTYYSLLPHLSEAATYKLRELNYQPLLLQLICRHPVRRLQNGIFYQGPLQNNLMEGLCQLVLPDGSYCQGRMLHSQLNGEGLLLNSQGDFYIGQFKNNKAEGKGMYKGDDFIYEGHFKNNLFWGNGKLTRPNECLEGYFEKGKIKKGKQTKYLQNNIYQGYFQGNKQNGYGKLYKNSQIHQGIFKNGYLQGEGKIFYQNGTSFICNYANGNVIGVIGQNERDIKYNEGAVKQKEGLAKPNEEVPKPNKGELILYKSIKQCLDRQPLCRL